MKAKINVEGMTCASCSAHVEKELVKLGGKEVNVNPVTGKAFLEVEDSITEEQLKEAVEEAGYKPLEVEFEKDSTSNN